MEDIGKKISEAIVRPGSLSLAWLGQSGFCIKAPDGTIVFIDPYLTDSISSGYKPYIHARMIPPVIPCDSGIDLKAILYTHDHMDHMDPNTVVQLLWNTDAFVVASPEVCTRVLKGSLRVNDERVRPLGEQESMDIGMLKISATPANHGPGAIGFIVESEKQCMYFCGDTQLFYTMPEIGSRWDIDAAFLCFNGQGGNMDIISAVALAKALKTSCVVPAHYGMYVDNNADPDSFELALQRNLPDVKFRVMKPGKLVEFTK